MEVSKLVLMRLSRVRTKNIVEFGSKIHDFYKRCKNNRKKPVINTQRRSPEDNIHVPQELSLFRRISRHFHTRSGISRLQCQPAQSRIYTDYLRRKAIGEKRCKYVIIEGKLYLKPARIPLQSKWSILDEEGDLRI